MQNIDILRSTIEEHALVANAFKQNYDQKQKDYDSLASQLQQLQQSSTAQTSATNQAFADELKKIQNDLQVELDTKGKELADAIKTIEQYKQSESSLKSAMEQKEKDFLNTQIEAQKQYNKAMSDKNYYEEQIKEYKRAKVVDDKYHQVYLKQVELVDTLTATLRTKPESKQQKLKPVTISTPVSPTRKASEQKAFGSTERRFS